MNDRTRTGRRALAAALALSALAAAPAGAAPVSVDLRVEGRTQTIYEGAVTTDGHDVTTPRSGTHKCDGTNGNAHPTPGPTATAALDDGARLGGFSWDGEWYSSFEDFLVTRVGPDSGDWFFFKNGKAPMNGGCQERVAQRDEVLWSYDAFNKKHVLRLAGPDAVATGETLFVRVTDAQDGSPVAGATVAGSTTGGDGRAALRFDQAGIYRLKAERPDSVRSRAIVLCVDPPGAPPCTSTDKTAPRLARLFLPGRYASERSRSRTILVAWQGEDPAGGSGVSSYGLAVREVEPGASAAAAEWRTIVGRTTLPRAHFKGVAGRTYEFRVHALDRAGNRGEVVTDPVVIPVDDRQRRLLPLSRGWKRLERKDAWGRFVLRSRRPGASGRFRFRGSRVVLIGRRLPRGGRFHVSVDGRSRTVPGRGRPRFREVLFKSRRLGRGPHVLRFEARGRGPVELDAVAAVP